MDVARRFVRLPRVEQTLLVVAVCVSTVCAQKSGTNEVSNAEVGETQRRREEADQNGGRAGSMTPPRNEDESSSVGRVIDATLPQANLDVTSSLTNLSSV